MREKHPGGDLRKIYEEAIHQYRKTRDQTLTLYPGVMVSLRRLKESGCIIVGYTESMGFYTKDPINHNDQQAELPDDNGTVITFRLSCMFE